MSLSVLDECMNIWIYEYMNEWIKKQRDKETKKQRNKETKKDNESSRSKLIGCMYELMYVWMNNQLFDVVIIY